LRFHAFDSVRWQRADSAFALQPRTRLSNHAPASSRPAASSCSTSPASAFASTSCSRCSFSHARLISLSRPTSPGQLSSHCLVFSSSCPAFSLVFHLPPPPFFPAATNRNYTPKNKDHLTCH
jgi:hypothetical protein